MDRQHAIERAEESAKFIRKFCRNEMRYGNCADSPFHMNAKDSFFGYCIFNRNRPPDDWRLPKEVMRDG